MDSLGRYLSTYVLTHLIGYFDGLPIPKLAKMRKVLGLCEGDTQWELFIWLLYYLMVCFICFLELL
jgi:hypothetical protein